jgi:transposase
MERKTEPYPSDVKDAEWEFCAPYLGLMSESAPQRKYSLRSVFNALRYIVRAGCPWRMLPHDLPPWRIVHEQAQRWFKAGSIEAMAHDLRELSRLLAGRTAQPTEIIIDSRTMQSSPESGARAGYDGYKRRKGTKAHIAVDTLGHLLALVTTPANEQDRAQVGELSAKAQEVTGEHVKTEYVDQGYTGKNPADAASEHGIQLVVVKLAQAKHGFVLLPKRWVVERSFGWAARMRRLSRDYERLASSLKGFHWLAFSFLLLSSIFSQT